MGCHDHEGQNLSLEGAGPKAFGGLCVTLVPQGIFERRATSLSAMAKPTPTSD
jgi:hypothetical protein